MQNAEKRFARVTGSLFCRLFSKGHSEEVRLMTLTLDELIKWILSQLDDSPSDKQKELIYRRVFLQDKEDGYEQE